MGPLDESCCLLPAPWRSHQAYPATATTRADTAAATSRCVYSISVGRASGGSNLPLHSGQCSPQPIPEPVIRTIAPRMMSRYVKPAAVQASRVKPQVMVAKSISASETRGSALSVNRRRFSRAPLYWRTYVSTLSRPLGRPVAAPPGSVERGRGARRLDNRRRHLPDAGDHRRAGAGAARDVRRLDAGRRARAVRGPHVCGAGRAVSPLRRRVRVPARGVRAAAGLPVRMGRAAPDPRLRARRHRDPVRGVLPALARARPDAPPVRRRRALGRRARDRADGDPQLRRRAVERAAPKPDDRGEVRGVGPARAARVRRGGGGGGGGDFNHFGSAAGPVAGGLFGLALVSVMWAYDGWGDLSFVGGEVRDPERNLPRALIIGTGAVVAIYLLVNAAYLYLLPIGQMAHSPLVAADAAQIILGRLGVGLVSLVVMVATFSTLLGSMLTAPRIFFAMADDGLFFKHVARVHPRFQTPWVAIVLTALLGIIYVSFRTFQQLADQFVVAIFPFYALAAAAVFTLRRRRPPAVLPRPVRVVGYPVVATLYMLGNALWQDPLFTGLAFAVILAGIPVYYVWLRGVTRT